MARLLAGALRERTKFQICVKPVLYEINRNEVRIKEQVQFQVDNTEG